ncbi:hypothetical protein BH09BAC2_BH09BAC2_12360 [soil metagenome]
MNQENVSVFMRENYTPTAIDKFLWWLSTAEKELVADSITDRNRYRIVGTTVLTTWMFATLAWIYFFSTIIGQTMVYILLGLFMGFVILTIDRALIKGISRFNKNRILPLLLRAALALTIGVFMAQPALLFMFDKEIQLQTSVDNEKKKAQKKEDLNTLYKAGGETLTAQKLQLQNESATKYAEVAQTRENYINEADGSGGTGKIGIKEIALAKKREYEKADSQFAGLNTMNQQKINAIDIRLQSIDSSQSAQLQMFEKYFNNGFLTRIEALSNLIKTNAALQYRYYLLVVILMLIELMPVLAKSLLPSGSYDEKVQARDKMDKETAELSVAHEQQLKELYNTLSSENDEDAIRTFFAHNKENRNEKMRKFSEQWKEEQHESFDGLWTRIKKDILSKKE